MFDRNHPIVFILVVLCSLEVLLVSKIIYTDYIWQRGGNIVFEYQENQIKTKGIILGDYESDFKFTEISKEDLEEIRNLEKTTRKVLGLPDEIYADVEDMPKVKIFEYANKNWQYFLIKNLPCGLQTYEGHQGAILLEKSCYDNPERRRQTYVHEYIHFLSNQGTAMMVKEADYTNTALTEAYTEMLCQRVLKDLKVKHIYKTRYENNIAIAKRLEEVSNGVTTKIFFRFSKANLLADSLPEYKELALLAKRREDRFIYYPGMRQDQKRINEILDSYESKTIWQ